MLPLRTWDISRVLGKDTPGLSIAIDSAPQPSPKGLRQKLESLPLPRPLTRPTINIGIIVRTNPQLDLEMR